MLGEMRVTWRDGGRLSIGLYGRGLRGEGRGDMARRGRVIIGKRGGERR